MANTLKFTSAEELRDKLKGFDQWLKDNGYPYKTVTRLAQYLDTTRATLIMYEDKEQSTVEDKEAENIKREILRAKREIEADEHDRLYDRNTNRGAEFSLKNNHGWRDRTDVGLDSSGLEIRLSPDLDKYSK